MATNVSQQNRQFDSLGGCNASIPQHFVVRSRCAPPVPPWRGTTRWDWWWPSFFAVAPHGQPMRPAPACRNESRRSEWPPGPVLRAFAHTAFAAAQRWRPRIDSKGFEVKIGVSAADYLARSLHSKLSLSSMKGFLPPRQGMSDLRDKTRL